MICHNTCDSGRVERVSGRVRRVSGLVGTCLGMCFQKYTCRPIHVSTTVSHTGTKYFSTVDWSDWREDQKLGFKLGLQNFFYSQLGFAQAQELLVFIKQIVASFSSDIDP